MEPRLAEKERNLDAALARLEEAAAAGAELLVLPECAIPGYMFDSAEEALPYAEEIPGPTTEAFERECARLGVHAITRAARARRRHAPQRRDPRRPRRPDRLLPQDASAVPGRRPLRHARATSSRSSTRALGRIGLIICYDLRFPEVTRTLALQGADLVALPTNFPMAAKLQSRRDHARARRREPHLPPRREPRRQGALGRVLRLEPDRRPVRHAARRGGRDRGGAARRGRRRSRRRGTRTTSSPASTSSTSSATAAPSCTARSSRSRARSKPEREERAMAKVEETFTWKALHEQDGLKVSESPWGPDDEIGRLNWITPDTNRAILEHLDGSHLFDLNVEYFIGMPSWVAAGDPPYGIWMTHTPQGSINDNLSGVGPTAARALLVLRRLDPPLHPLRDARRHAQPPRPPRDVLERLDGGQGPRQPHLEQGRPRQVPADHLPRPCCSTSRG